MGRCIQIQEMIAISNNGEILKSATKEQRGKALYVKEADSGVDDRVGRMATHIENLAKEANKAHIKLKGSIEDVLITRLVMNEFSFYTKDKPLSLAEYKLLIKKIHGIASTLPPDIHLLLATIPVLWPDNNIHNCALYIQSPPLAGEKPIIHHFSKENISASDFHYMDKNGHPIPLQTDKDDDPDDALDDTEVNTWDINQVGGVLKIITAEGFSFITLIDICLDHQTRVAEKNLEILLEALNDFDQEIPLYMSQVITSHIIAPIRKNVFTSLTQADRTYKGVNGEAPKEEIHLVSSFGDFVDITIFPPVYLEIPYRKRVLRNLSTAVAGQDILKEIITNPGSFPHLNKQILALTRLGVSMSPEVQNLYLTHLYNYLFFGKENPFEIAENPTAPSPTNTPTKACITADSSAPVSFMPTRFMQQPEEVASPLSPTDSTKANPAYNSDNNAYRFFAESAEGKVAQPKRACQEQLKSEASNPDLITCAKKARTEAVGMSAAM